MQLTYNGVQLGGYLLTRSIEQGPVYDPSRSDKLYDRIRIQVQSVINASFLPAEVAEPPAETMVRVRHMLTTPRRSLVFADDTATYINLPGGLDDANGPMPDESCISISELTPASWLVSFAVTVNLVDCGTSPPPYLSNRWEESTSYDRDWYCVKRRTGTLIVSSRGPASPDDLRSLISPPVDGGFRRDTADYRRSADGLKMSYTFVDRQLAKMPPIPGTKLSGQQIESSPVYGGKRFGQLNLTLSAPPAVDPRDLMTALMRVGMARINQSNPIRDNKGRAIIIDGAVTENLDDEKNDVSLSVRWQMQPTAARTTGQGSPNPHAVGGGAVLGGILGGILGGPLGAGIGANAGASVGSIPTTTPENVPQDAIGSRFSWIGKPLAGTDGIAYIAPPVRGWDLAAAVQLTASALRDPCGTAIELTNAGEENTLVGTSGESTLTASQLTTNDTPDDTQALYTDDGPGVWEYYEVTARYKDDTGERVMPPAVPGGDVKIARMHGRYLLLQLEWSLTRVGGNPAAPIINEVSDPNWRYLNGVTAVKNLDVAGDGASIRYQADGVWNFVCINVSKSNITYPIPPFLSPTLLRASSVFGAAGVAAGSAVASLTAGGSGGVVDPPDSGSGTTQPSVTNNPPSFFPFGVMGMGGTGLPFMDLSRVGGAGNSGP